MMDHTYLVDSNALVSIGTRRWQTAFFQSRCLITEDVAYEVLHRARYLPADVIVPMTPAILGQIPEMMRTITAGDTRLLDLYGNKGAADPVLVATAVVLQAEQSQYLDGDTVVVVTRDSAVSEKAVEFGIKTALPDELAALIDDAERRTV